MAEIEEVHSPFSHFFAKRFPETDQHANWTPARQLPDSQWHFRRFACRCCRMTDQKIATSPCCPTRLNRPACSACSKAVVDYFPDIDQWQPFGSTWAL
ncbi:hypothetical protein P355_4781 [Burkholderia cenocepacia KC-01]|nr:hypothetical protein P355_4781 [Burkholderia cenocepacia KC-01]